MRVVSLGSGSSGNALLVEAGRQGQTKLLIDAGLNGHVLAERLWRVGVYASQLQGVLVTHEHSDHCLGLPALIRRYGIPVVTDTRTHDVIKESISSENTGRGPVYRAQDPCVVPTLTLNVGERRVIGNIEVTSFPVSHDAVAPCGYLLKAGGCRICLITDSGEVTLAMLEAMQYADLLIVEANHDRERLLRGPYPQNLKQRILSTTGHLSNEQAAEAILRTWRADGVRWIWLAHLSRTNNTPSLALKSVCTRLEAAKANLAQVHISVLPPGIGSVWDSTLLWRSDAMWEWRCSPLA